MRASRPLIVPNERLDFAAAHGPPHLRPIYRAIRHGNVDHLIMLPNGPAFRPGARRPIIALIADDLPSSQGCRSFHRKSLVRLLRQAGHVSIMLGAPVPAAYARSASHAVTTGETVVMVETAQRREREWIDFISAANPRLGDRPMAETYEVEA